MRHYSQSHTRVVLEQPQIEQEILPLQELWRECDALTVTLRDPSVEQDALLAIEEPGRYDQVPEAHDDASDLGEERLDSVLGSVPGRGPIGAPR